ncbi:cation transporter [Oscillospiraceae bacterium HV4-5-C5C]|nr:cation transporter [Oscillospiraceae bacterium HV4-5-C5C]
MTRSQIIVRTGVVGILANVLLAVFKVAVGWLSHSVAILLDAINNLSDALSSVITIVGARLSEKPADKEHPLGYGRVEYLSAMLIAGLVLFAGASSLVESVKKIITPNQVSYSLPMLIVVAVAIAGKLLLGAYTKSKGKLTQSGALIDSGSDALFDAVVTGATLLSAVATLIWQINLDGWLGVVISLVILKAGLGMLSDTLNDLLGKRVSPQLAEKIKASVCAVPGVLGAYDLFLDSYGPQKQAGSVHIALSNRLSADEVSRLARRVSATIYQEYGIVLTCGIYAVETKNKAVMALRDEITAVAMKYKGVLQVHGLYIDEPSKLISFDVVRDFSVKDVDGLISNITAELTRLHPEYHYHIQPDLDLSD